MADLSAVLIVGPTASGKTDLAHELACRWDARMLSLDSMMVYRDMNIGTAKPDPEEAAHYDYAGLNLAAPTDLFNVSQYLGGVSKQLVDTTRNIVGAGGTGLYANTLVYGLDDLPEGNPDQRSAWQTRLESEGLPALLEELKKLDPDLYQSLPDRQNPRRVIRALETAGTARSKPTSRPWHGCPLVGLRWDREQLKDRIRLRTAKMFEKGLVEETRRLYEKYGTLSRTAGQAIGYREAHDVLDGKVTADEAVKQVNQRTFQYAKRQMTWFRNQAPIVWLDAGTDRTVSSLADQAEELVEHYGRTHLNI